MKVPCRKGMSHFVLARESCVGRREAVDEALTAARVGRALSTEIHIVRSAEAVIRVEGNTGRPALARGGRAPRCPRPQGTHVRPAPGPGRPSSHPGCKVGAAKVKAGAERRTHGWKESDPGLVAKKPANKAAGAPWRSRRSEGPGATGARSRQARAGHRAGFPASQASAPHGSCKGVPSRPERGAGCLSGHARICAGGVG